MKLIGLMLVRNEQWVLGASLRAALTWCDEMVVLDHASTDRSGHIITDVMVENRRNPNRIHAFSRHNQRNWDEMDHRQAMLLKGREHGGTHFAMIDADEILTGNLMIQSGTWAEELAEGEVLELPMVPCWRSLEKYRCGDSVWARAWLSLVFRDHRDLHWARRADGYQHHSRTPHNCGKRIRRLEHGQGGVFHLQWANWPRLLAKHVHYRMMEHVRWPDRMSVEKLNAKYDAALDENGIVLSDVPASWWAPYPDLVERIDAFDRPWYLDECWRLVAEHGRDAFTGLDLKGLVD